MLHFDYKNMSNIYSLGDEVINAENEEKDLGFIVSDTLKPSSQCTAAAKSANKTLGMINTTLVNRESKIILKLYQSLVIPKLENCVQYLKKDIDLLEKVQKRATRLMIKDRSLSYEERLRRLGLTSLETRRLRGDLIEVFEIFKGFDNIKHTKCFTVRYRT